LPTAFATAIGYPVNTLICLIGHDGGHIQWPQFPEPKRRRGFHHQECVQAVWRIGFAVTQFELRPRYVSDLSAIPLEVPLTKDVFDRLIAETRGVLTGCTRRCGHAVAYDHGHICDPRGLAYRYSDSQSNDFSPLCLFVLTPRPQ
jgi:hypothetical protein